MIFIKTIIYIVIFLLFVSILYDNNTFHYNILENILTLFDFKVKKERFKKSSKKTNSGEAITRQIFEEYFSCKFKKVRMLVNPFTGHKLELDGYNSNIKTKLGYGLAFEYDGEQHYKKNNFFHKNNDECFSNQINRDIIKNELCLEKNIYLIRIPYYIKKTELKEYIHKKLKNIN